MIRMVPGKVNVLKAVCSCGRTQACSNRSPSNGDYAAHAEIIDFLTRCGWRVEPRDVFEKSICVCPFCLISPISR
jgi:hypothetical protein